MDLPGLMTVKPAQRGIIEQLSRMVGTSFMEEGWNVEFLSALDAIGSSAERKREISQAIIKCDFTVGAPYQCVYALPDLSAAAGGYLQSELQGRTWDELSNESSELLATGTLSEEEQDILSVKKDEMAPVSVFDWIGEYAGDDDFIHWFVLGVDPEKRGSGSFRKLISPFLDYADAHGLLCFLECYSDKTEAIYGHFGFETMKRFSDPRFGIVERCMARRPRGCTEATGISC